jgi:hypothetical protein
MTGVALLIALAMGLAPVTHRAAPPDVPAWVLADLCGESGDARHDGAPCAFCLLHAACALLAPADAAPLRLAQRPIATAQFHAPLPPSPRLHHRPPLRGPPGLFAFT